MTETTTLAAHIGQNVRKLRQAKHQTQEQLAVRLGWQQSHVAALEAGDRATLPLDDVLLLCAELGATISDLMAGDGKVALTRRGRPHREATLVALRNVGLAETMPRGEGIRGEVAIHLMTSDTERKAARKLGVAPERVTAAALGRWGHSLAAERDRRLKARAKPGASDRSIQALRGHITRELLDEIQPTIGANR
jgi:transcriptional regulator with XRE-family HTH domain